MGRDDDVTVLLIESSLELVPPEIAGHPSVIRNAGRRGKKPTEVLLDVSLHYHAMRKLRNRGKRGRPDIVHVTLLELLSSPLNLEGRLRLLIHTVNDYVIEVSPETRIPRNYNRFVGLMEQLLTAGRVPPNSEEPLMKARPSTLTSLLKELGADGIILLSEGGVRVSPRDICRKAVELEVPIAIGCFPHGDFSEEAREAALETYSIYGRTLDTWVVASRIASGCEELFGII